MVQIFQRAQAGTFAEGEFPSVARSTTDKLNFKNVCGGIKFSVKRDDIYSVTFRSNKGEKVSGMVACVFDDSGNPVSESIDEGASYVSLFSNNTPFTPGEWYYISLLPVTLSEGFTMEFDGRSGNIGSFTSNKPQTIKRSVFGTIPEADEHVEFSKPIPPINSVQPVRESFECHYANYYGGGLTGSASDVYSFEGEIFTVPGLDRMEQRPNNYFLASYFRLEYKVNPADFNVEDYDWSLVGPENGRWQTRISETKKNASGNLELLCSIIRLDALLDSDQDRFVKLYCKPVDADRDAWTEVAKADITPVEDNIESINVPLGSTLPGNPPQSATDAIIGRPDFSVKFSETLTFDINKIRVNVLCGGIPCSIPLKELQSRYPDFQFTMMSIPVKCNISSLSEDYYCTLKQDDAGNWVFTPAYPENGSAVEMNPGNLLYAAEAVGHSPVLVMALKNHLGRYVAPTYVRVMIEDDESADTGEVTRGFGTKDFIFKEYNLYPLMESEEVRCYSDEDIPVMNSGLGMPYKRFRSLFVADDATYVQEYGRFIATDEFGSLTVHHPTSGTMADRFTISLTLPQKMAIGMGNTKVLYKRFFNNYGDVIYVGFKISVGSVSVVFVSHIPRYWYSDINSEYNTVRMEVPFPLSWRPGSYGNTDIRYFSFDLRNTWENQTISIKNSDGGLSYEAIEHTHLEWVFDRSSNQPRYNGKRFTVNSDENELMWGNDSVMSIEKTSGIVSYVWNSDPSTAPMTLINQWGPTETSADKMLYCRVLLRSYYYSEQYGIKIILGEEPMNVRVMRPLTLEAKTDSYLTDGLPGVDFVTVGDLFMLKGLSMQYPLFEKSGDTFQVCKYPKPENFQVDLYGYMGVESMSLDLYNAEVESNNRRTPFSTYNHAMMLWLTTKDALYTQRDSYNVDISDVESLGNYTLSFADTMPGYEDFTIIIPITIKYAWGELKSELKVPVKSYQNN